MFVMYIFFSMNPDNSDNEVILIESRKEQMQEVEAMLKNAKSKFTKYRQCVEQRKKLIRERVQKKKRQAVGAQVTTEIHNLCVWHSRVRTTRYLAETSRQQLEDRLNKFQQSISTDIQRYIELSDELAKSQQRYPPDDKDIDDELVYRC